jgi:broad specificity phosphatase PhoE
MHATTGSRYPRASHDSHVNASMDAEENRTPVSVRRAPSMRTATEFSQQDLSPGRDERAFRSGNERLYEAYNDLHSLAQDFEKPFDAPAILVVGHQTDGKSGARGALPPLALLAYYLEAHPNSPPAQPWWRR